MENETERRLIALVLAKPGVPVMELARKANIASGTLYYHLQRLCAEGRIRVMSAGRRRLVFSSDMTDPSIAPRLSRLHGRSARVMAKALLVREGACLSEFEAETGLSRRAVTYQMRHLERLGLARTSRHLDGTRAWPTETLVGLLREQDGEIP